MKCPLFPLNKLYSKKKTKVTQNFFKSATKLLQTTFKHSKMAGGRPK